MDSSNVLAVYSIWKTGSWSISLNILLIGLEYLPLPSVTIFVQHVCYFCSRFGTGCTVILCIYDSCSRFGTGYTVILCVYDSCSRFGTGYAIILCECTLCSTFATGYTVILCECYSCSRFDIGYTIILCECTLCVPDLALATQSFYVNVLCVFQVW